jgi:hypothetical protein
LNEARAVCREAGKILDSLTTFQENAPLDRNVKRKHLKRNLRRFRKAARELAVAVRGVEKLVE